MKRDIMKDFVFQGRAADTKFNRVCILWNFTLKCFVARKTQMLVNARLFFLPHLQDRHNTPAVVLACNAMRHPGDRQASSKWFRKTVKYKSTQFMLYLKTCLFNKWDINNNIFITSDLICHQIKPLLLKEVKLCKSVKKKKIIICFCLNIIFNPCASGSLVTGADYLPPPKGVPYLSPQKEPKSRYRYLDSDGALLRTPVWPLPSETKV